MKLSFNNSIFSLLFITIVIISLSTLTGRPAHSNSGSVKRERPLIAASEITWFGAKVRKAVSDMLSAGVSATAVSLDPEDTSTASVFSSSGGGVRYEDPPEFIGDETRWKFISLKYPTIGIYIADVGTNLDISGRDAVAILEDLPLSVCTQINRAWGFHEASISNNSPMSDVTVPTYSVGKNVFDAYPGERFACVRMDNINGVYTYYHALIEN